MKQTRKHTINSEEAAQYTANSAEAAGCFNGFTDAERTIIADALSLIQSKFIRAEPIKSPDMTRQMLILRHATLPHEEFSVVYLDNRHRVIDIETLFTGTIDGASVHPREVVRACLRKNAAAVIFSHNHPSGVAEPSQADRNITRRLADALGFIDVRVLDHIITAGTDSVSFAERGMI
jgi:DNA repair protein RadC